MKTIPENIIKAVVSLMDMEAKHARKIYGMQEASGCDLNGLHVDLCDMALDLLGVPPDNAMEQEEKHGRVGMIDHKDIFSRGDLCFRWEEIVDGGTPEEWAAYPSWVLEQLK